jgi:hypothetical protein
MQDVIGPDGSIYVVWATFNTPSARGGRLLRPRPHPLNLAIHVAFASTSGRGVVGYETDGRTWSQNRSSWRASSATGQMKTR